MTIFTTLETYVPGKRLIKNMCDLATLGNMISVHRKSSARSARLFLAALFDYLTNVWLFWYGAASSRKCAVTAAVPARRSLRPGHLLAAGRCCGWRRGVAVLL